MLVDAGLETSTRKTYDGHLDIYLNWCKDKHHDPISPTCDIIQDFISWCYNYTEFTGGVMCSTITGIMSYIKDNGKYFDRSKHPVIRRQLDGFLKKRPPKKRPKRPIMDVFVLICFKHIINTKKYIGWVVGAAICLGYWHGMRPGEYTKHSGTLSYHILRVKNQYFGPIGSKHHTENVIILFDGSKTNRVHKHTEILACSCTCKSHPSLPCSLHWFKGFLKARYKQFGDPDKNDPLFLLPGKKILKYEHAANCIKTTIEYINDKYGLNLNIDLYALHGLRVGACTDKMRQGWSESQVKKWGRWSSDIWDTTYWTLDTRDYCAITKIHTTI